MPDHHYHILRGSPSSRPVGSHNVRGGIGSVQGKGRSLCPKGLAQTMTSPQAIAAFRIQALERSRGGGTRFALILGRASKRGGLGKRLLTRSKSKARPTTQARRAPGIFPPRSGLVQVEKTGVQGTTNARSGRGRPLSGTREPWGGPFRLPGTVKPREHQADGTNFTFVPCCCLHGASSIAKWSVSQITSRLLRTFCRRR